ncbi:MAG TPA: alpha-1,4-glucan--maltose-1-phosphate maltosyltransferase [Steroidobacteraceae bacterium]|jgi:starch synthase (maltosyl-transferring)|nr:alpha-1,4-glucan--maltose-1-phosphate maltosyltransferase [Steroidobacteraceae bacterium]
MAKASPTTDSTRKTAAPDTADGARPVAAAASAIPDEPDIARPAEGIGIADGRVRAVIDAVNPSLDGGRFPAKRIAGEAVEIRASCFADGHDKLRVRLGWRPEGPGAGYESEMEPLGNDVWRARFTAPRAGRYRYTVTAWVDHFESWSGELGRREDAADVRIALEVGAALIEEAARRAHGAGSVRDAAALEAWAAELRAAVKNPASDTGAQKALALDAARAEIAARHADRSLAVSVSRELVVDRPRARFSAWYELFPRSAAAEPGRHGTFRDVEQRLPYLAEMGFDVLYFPPIHPIGRINRKGRNNTLDAKPGDVGSPWAIGSEEGGHKDIHPALGTHEGFRRLLSKARDAGLEVALDIAFQCAPDHPYVKAHPDWFKHRPDGSVQYAENPPKKYQDIYPFDFECADWRALWAELESVVEFWIAQGVRIFRVDNPHTKPFDFWEWLIGSVKRNHPEVIFLAEAFTRPKLMHRLAKLGFSQSYTYFTWRNSKRDLIEYFTELAQGPGRDYYRPNVWPNTPDILHETLQSGSRPVFAARLILAATLAASYGIYGPTYELLDGAPREPGGEEYRDSEKYQLRHWSLEQRDSLWSLIARMNRIRRANPALQSDATLRFVPVDNERLIAYAKTDAASGDAILTVVNLDPDQPQSGWLDLDLAALDLDADQPFQVHDLLSEQRYIWHGPRNYVLLDPRRSPAHVLKVRRRVRSERDFDYYL